MSIDNNAEAAALVEKHRLNFPVGYRVDADKIAARPAPTSTTVRAICNPLVLFSIPSGKVITAVYSSGAIGRLLPEDVIGFVVT